MSKNDLIKRDDVIHYIRQFQLDEYIPDEQYELLELVIEGIKHLGKD